MFLHLLIMPFRRILRRRRLLLWSSLCLVAVVILVVVSKSKTLYRKKNTYIFDGGPWFRKKKVRAINSNSKPGSNFKPELEVMHKQTIPITLQQSKEEIENNFFKYLETKEVICKNDRRLGFQHDGGWNVCMSPPFELNKPCLIYSFGIGGDWRFEDEVSDGYGCLVLAFDPSMHLTKHNRTDLIHFKPLGLGGEDRTTARGWKLKTFLTHLVEEGHTQSIINYLKFDIEFEEWYALKTMIIDDVLKNVKQLGFELHMKHPQETRPADLEVTKEDFIRMYDVLELLEGMNFKKFNYRLNPFCNYASNITKRIRSRCYELHYMNMRFVKLYHIKGLDTKIAMLNR